MLAMKMITAIPALPVAKMTDGVRFYHETLGFAVAHQEDGFAVLTRDQIQIHLWGATDESWRTRKDGKPIESGAESFLAGTHSCRIEVDGIDELYRELEPKKVMHPNAPLANKPWGTREFGVSDPYGNLITFFQGLKITDNLA